MRVGGRAHPRTPARAHARTLFWLYHLYQLYQLPPPISQHNPQE